MPQLLFDSSADLIRIIINVPILYIALIIFINLSGKRSMSQMNNFDWLVTVAMGSIVASGIILKDVSLAETLLSIALLLGMQYLLTGLASRSQGFSRLVKMEPRLLFHQGEFLEQAMRDERISKSEILAAIREAGYPDRQQIQWVILENDATLSVIPEHNTHNLPEHSALSSVQGFPPA